jgi:hypothetical protein
LDANGACPLCWHAAGFVISAAESRADGYSAGIGLALPGLMAVSDTGVMQSAG